MCILLVSLFFFLSQALLIDLQKGDHKDYIFYYLLTLTVMCGYFPHIIHYISKIPFLIVYEVLLAWSKSSFRVFHKVLRKSPNELFGQLNTECICCNLVNQSPFVGISPTHNCFHETNILSSSCLLDSSKLPHLVLFHQVGKINEAYFKKH